MEIKVNPVLDEETVERIEEDLVGKTTFQWDEKTVVGQK